MGGIEVNESRQCGVTKKSEERAAVAASTKRHLRFYLVVGLSFFAIGGLATVATPYFVFDFHEIEGKYSTKWFGSDDIVTRGWVPIWADEREYHGPYLWFHASGQLMSESAYVDGLADGVSRQYYPDGSLRLVTLFDHGEPLAGAGWDVNGKPELEVIFDAGAIVETRREPPWSPGVFERLREQKMVRFWWARLPGFSSRLRW